MAWGCHRGVACRPRAPRSTRASAPRVMAGRARKGLTIGWWVAIPHKGSPSGATRFDKKLARGLDGRRGLAARLAAWAATHRDPKRPLVWMHAPSVGEGLQAKPVLRR